MLRRDSYDFINILQPIIINAELVRDSLPADASEREYLSQIMRLHASARRSRTR